MTDARPPRIELWLRGSVPVDIRRTQMAVHDRLQQRCADGTIDDVAVHTWEREAYVPTDDRAKTEACEKFDEFERWATEHDWELEPGFDRHRRSSIHTDEPVEAVTLPIMCLAVYDDRSLRAVAPCSDGDRVFTVHDCLAALDVEAGPSVGDQSTIPTK